MGIHDNMKENDAELWFCPRCGTALEYKESLNGFNMATGEEEIARYWQCSSWLCRLLTDGRRHNECVCTKSYLDILRKSERR